MRAAVNWQSRSSRPSKRQESSTAREKSAASRVTAENAACSRPRPARQSWRPSLRRRDQPEMRASGNRQRRRRQLFRPPFSSTAPENTQPSRDVPSNTHSLRRAPSKRTSTNSQSANCTRSSRAPARSTRMKRHLRKLTRSNTAPERFTSVRVRSSTTARDRVAPLKSAPWMVRG